MDSEPQNSETLLVHDHADLDGVLSELDQAFDAKDLERSLELLDLFWGRLGVHIRAENVHLFPTLLRASELSDTRTSTDDVVPRQEMHELVNQLLDDHNFFMKQLIPAVKKLKLFCQNKEPEGLEEIRATMIAVRRRLEAHNLIEESRVYRQARFLLSPTEQSTLNQKIQSDLENIPLRLRKKS